MIIPKYSTSDMEPTFINAYYRHVCGCYSVVLPEDNEGDFVARLLG